MERRIISLTKKKKKEVHPMGTVLSSSPKASRTTLRKKEITEAFRVTVKKKNEQDKHLPDITKHFPW